MMDLSTEGREIQLPIEIWQHPETIAKEIQDRHQPVDYMQIVGDNRVLFLAENHRNYSIRYHLAHHARTLKAAGITHYAIEAQESGNEFFEKLNKGEPVDFSHVDIGPGGADYEEAIRVMAAQGIQVVAVDMDRRTKPTPEQREARITENIHRLLEADPNTKVALLIGAFHTSRYTLTEGMPHVGRRMMEARIPTVKVHFAGGEAKGPTNLKDAVINAGLADHEFMLNFQHYANLKFVPFGKGEADWIIHLPQQQ